MADWCPSWILGQAPRPSLRVREHGEGVSTAGYADAEGMHPDPSVNPEAATNLNRGFGEHLLALGGGAGLECQVTGKVSSSRLYWGSSHTGEGSWVPETGLSGSWKSEAQACGLSISGVDVKSRGRRLTGEERQDPLRDAGQDSCFLLLFRLPSAHPSPALCLQDPGSGCLLTLPLPAGRCPAQAWKPEGLSVLRGGSTCTDSWGGPATAPLPLPPHVGSSGSGLPSASSSNSLASSNASSLWLRRPYRLHPSQRLAGPVLSERIIYRLLSGPPSFVGS